MTRRSIMIKRSIVVTGVALHLAAGVALAGDETYEELLEAYGNAQQEWFVKMESMQKNMEEGEAWDMTAMPPQPQAEFVPRFKELAERHAGTSDAVRPLVWVASNPIYGMTGANTEHVVWAMGVLKERHAADSAIAEAFPSMEHMTWTLGREPITEFCETVLEVNTSDEVRAGATFTLAVNLYTLMAESDEGRDPERAEVLFRSIGTDFGESSYAKRASNYLFEIDHLQVGMKAPEVTGLTLDGEAIALSQFEGQVVVLDFWGFW